MLFLKPFLIRIKDFFSTGRIRQCPTFNWMRDSQAIAIYLLLQPLQTRHLRGSVLIERKAAVMASRAPHKAHSLQHSKNNENSRQEIHSHTLHSQH